MKIIALVVFILLVGSQKCIKAQSRASATASAVIVSTVSIESAVYEANIEQKADDRPVKIMAIPTSQKSVKSSFFLPLIKKTITFANLKISDATLGCYDISLPSTVTLKNKAGTENITAYSFRVNQKQNMDNVPTKGLELSAIVAVTADQSNELFVSEKVDVIINYN